MSDYRPVPLSALAVSVLVAVALAAPASAAAARFSCRASALQAVYAGSKLEPTVANAASTPCADAVTRTQRGSITAVHFGVGGGFTHVRRRRDEAPGAGALASLTRISITSSTDQVTIDAAQARASFACAAGSLEPAGVSQVTGVTVDGKPISVPGDGAQAGRVPVGTGGSYLLLNQSTTTATSLTRTAAMLHLVGVGDFTIAEAVVTAGVPPGGCALPGRLDL